MHLTRRDFSRGSLAAILAAQSAPFIVRAQDGYGLPEWIRISVGTPAENARCIEVLKEVL